MDTDDITCVILAGGQGKRMASAGRHKVCFAVAGRPAIVRAIDTYKQAGVKRFIVVVGQLAGQVISTVAAVHPEVMFVFQAEPRGTGHAAMIAAEALASQNYHGAVMVTMGDKIMRASVVRRMLEHFGENDLEMLIATLPKTHRTSAGRVVTDARDKVLGVVETQDIAKARRKRTRIKLAGRSFSAEQVEQRGASVNASLYIFRFDSFREALGQLDTNNAQGELYLTDTVEYLARRGSVGAMFIPRPTDLMAFNAPAELLEVEETVLKREKPPRVSVVSRRRISPRMLKSAGEWLKVVTSRSPKWLARLRRTYGRDEALIDERCKTMRSLVQAFTKRFGRERPMVLCRAPGRINLMGRHVDHRGGFVNVMAISRETLLAAAPRDDDVVTLRNLRSRLFPYREFRIWDLLREFSWADWMEFLGSRAAQSVIQAAPGDWSHYARAPLLRLQHECRGVHLKGMDCLVSGNIPMGAGLSSSSALVVAFAEAAVTLNRLNVAMHDFIDLCGEGEWFVGSRGGSADHAAIRTGRAGYVSAIDFFPFRLAGEVRFPRQLSVVVAHSGLHAIKSTVARDVFNQRVACYELAEMLLRRRWPVAAGMEHLRDLAPKRLKVKPGEIYRGLMQLPVRPTRRELRRLLPAEDHDRLEQIFSTHAWSGGYNLRGVAMFGIGECLRSEMFANVLGENDLPGVGKFMRTSHDGDRVVRFDSHGRARRHLARTDDKTLRRLASEDADPSRQPGRYACSTEAIDRIVDVAFGTEGVVGAQLAGAGLGGCAMILAHSDALDNLSRRLRKYFYNPRKLPFGALVCKPVAGAALMEA